MAEENKIWFITGVSGGLGFALAVHAAQKGNTVIGTLRQKQQISRFNKVVEGRTYGMNMDITREDEIREGVNSTIERFGRIDVLVNNAGYGLLGAIEEVDIAEAREQMETNFFGMFLMIKAVLPFMRKQRSGHIVQISSGGGFHATQGMGFYNASKFAMEGFSEALSLEVRPLNIRVIIVEPSPLRTQFAGTSSKRARTVIQDYEETAGKLIDIVHANSGKQDGDPRKAAEVIFTAVQDPQPPLRLPLGNFVLEEIRSKIASVENDISRWREVITRISFDP